MHEETLGNAEELEAGDELPNNVDARHTGELKGDKKFVNEEHPLFLRREDKGRIVWNDEFVKEYHLLS